MVGKNWAVKENRSTADTLALWTGSRDKPQPSSPVAEAHGHAYVGHRGRSVVGQYGGHTARMWSGVFRPSPVSQSDVTHPPWGRLGGEKQSVLPNAAPPGKRRQFPPLKVTLRTEEENPTQMSH